MVGATAWALQEGQRKQLGHPIEKSAPCVKALIRDVRTYADKCNGSLRPVPIARDNVDIDTSLHPRASWLGYYDCPKDGNEKTRAEWYDPTKQHHFQGANNVGLGSPHMSNVTRPSTSRMVQLT
ncbi:hypothetical protein H257_16228 [Aphanomyces astaci]|uniref:Uncharacterized protein n=1 Tax=Aphanomyces astaci TaxID=112090 RepID=W4FJG2_APHAT|nr:hypothetical protein H257_16228 [Aphanomyces astaci]ETV67637.1 hypothetical protein H257_16228 [Aphanomyces astaci]|eukprot:XP_009842894.1 hypothetical protein H257_16228 [Aphanomyces astaci]